MADVQVSDQSVLNLLHLSDIHFRDGESGDVYDLDTDLRNELERDAERMRTRLKTIGGIVVTGDIAFGGKKEEYDIARVWLEKLCNVLGCAHESVWTVPGNHDVDRQVIDNSETLRTFHDRLRRASDIDSQIAAFMRDVVAKRVLFDPIVQYNVFAARFQCDLAFDRPYWDEDLLLNDGSKLRMRGLNTTLISWTNDDDKANKLLLGSIQSKPPTFDDVTYMTLCHHPPQWLIDDDDVSQNLSQRVRVQLFGHKHKQRVELIDNSVRVTAGAIHPNRREPEWCPRYNVISLSVDGTNNSRTLNVITYPRVWNKDDGIFQGDYDASGSDVRTHVLKLGTWNRPPERHQSAASTIVGEAPNTLRLAEAKLPQEKDQLSQESGLMNKARRLVYRFYSLPYDVRIEVAQGLHLIREDDEGLQGGELFNRLLRRAKDENMLSRLWEEVQRAHGDDLHLDNPFGEGRAG